MSDAEIFRPQPETSNMPIVLASVISLTLHGLLWVAPPISMSRQKADTKLNVGLVQLTPEEVSRLQEFSDPALSLPPLPPTLPSTDVLPPLPSPLGPTASPSLQQQEELVRQQIVQRQQALLQRQLQQQEKLLRQQMRRNQELIRKQKLEQQEALQRQIEQEKQRQTEQMRREIEQEKQSQELLRQQEKQRQAEIERRQQEQQKQREELVRKQQEVELLDQWQKQEEFFAPLKKQLQRQRRREIVKGMYGYNTTGTTATEGNTSFTIWLDAKNKQFGYISPKLKEDINIKSTAKMQLPDVTQASIALLVDSEGKVEGEPLLMISTSYPSLNQAVIDDAKKRSFEPTGKYEIYMYRVNIDQSNLPPTP